MRLKDHAHNKANKAQRLAWHAYLRRPLQGMLRSHRIVTQRQIIPIPIIFCSSFAVYSTLELLRAGGGE